ncbi:isopenicillin N synthase family dioxygenase [Frankia sp. AgKG'84/4]|uniref:isopenicillin N synthase family dioxygenase n=1 Tax=Frankia sp. AgKG'84/4 TaxID=573490 RepID=UPI00200CDDAE|nr:2-oxoglutarate and iron-dependent oxygenase domain-containing protein [Frankia sp. AgKG'84/4]MCL9797178.1 isopenicillin N synthase family oxygenase [Frankia sp. AgKG'84/4]
MPAARRDLPSLDIGPFLAGTAGRGAFLDALRRACHGPGFFYLTGHGIPAAQTGAVLEVSRRFFRLPAAAKLEIENIHSPHFRGYTRLGHEITRGSADLREQIDISDERPARTLGPDDPLYLRLDGPNQWPRQVPELRAAVLAHMTRLGELSRSLVRAFAESLGLPAGHFDRSFAHEPRSHVKLIRYLAPADKHPAEYDQGVGSHKDGGFVTFVLQDDVRSLAADGPRPASPGLQVADGAGGWLDAAPRPGTFVVNIGEMFELATRGYYRATVHRVVSPPPGHERLSVAYFFGPRLSATLEPVPLPAELAREIDDPSPPDPDNPIFAQHGENTLKSWLRSHPEVARRHYADVDPPKGHQ